MDYTPQIKVLLVDDDNTMAAGIKKLFEEYKSIVFKGTVFTPEKCLARMAGKEPVDIIMIDVRFPKSDLNGLQLVEEIRKVRPFTNGDGKIIGPRIVFFSIEEFGFVDRERGIHGLIPKGEDFKMIVQMLEMIYKFGATFPPKEDRSPREKPGFFAELTPAEKQVFCGVISGKTTDEIADERKPSPEEIAASLRSIRRKIKEAGFEVTEIGNPEVVRLIRKDDKRFKFSKRECKIVLLIASGISVENLPGELKPIHAVIRQRREILREIRQYYPKIDRIDDPRIIRLAAQYNLCREMPV